jgi:hypothetical protein
MLIPNVSIHYGKLNNQSQKYYVKSNEVEYFDNLFSNREFSLKPNNLSETVIEMLNKVANKFNINSEKLELIYKNNGGAH